MVSVHLHRCHRSNLLTDLQLADLRRADRRPIANRYLCHDNVGSTHFLLHWHQILSDRRLGLPSCHKLRIMWTCKLRIWRELG